MQFAFILLLLFAKLFLGKSLSGDCPVAFTKHRCYHGNVLNTSEQQWVYVSDNRTGDAGLTEALLRNISCECAKRATDKGHKAFGLEMKYINIGKENTPALLSNCSTALGMEHRKIPDWRISASTEASRYNSAANGRLHSKRARRRRTGAWSSQHICKNNTGQWLQVDFGSVTNITGIATQGSENWRQWVQSYTLTYSDDGKNFTPYQNYKVFLGNTDKNTVVRNSLDSPIVTRFVRIYPKKCFNRMSMRTEFYGCKTGNTSAVDKNCSSPLGMENRTIPDRNITALSQRWNATGPANSRLNFKAIEARESGWTARKDDSKPWLQVDFASLTNITGVASQGAQKQNHWVTKYNLSHSVDGNNSFIPYKKDFMANNDSDTVVKNPLPTPIIARSVRVHPTSWNGAASMRVEFYGCRVGNTSNCSSPLGLENGAIPDKRISASSEKDTKRKAANGRLNFKDVRRRSGAWSAKLDVSSDYIAQWLQVDFGSITNITGIATQGRADQSQWVKTFELSYSDDGNQFTSAYSLDHNDKVFKGNTDQNTVIFHSFAAPMISARYVRISPKTWHNHISMRVEFYGCRPESTSALDKNCSAALGMENGTIPDSNITASSQFGTATGPENSRLNFRGVSARAGGWRSRDGDQNPWFQVDFASLMNITGFATQGMADKKKWFARSYSLSYKDDVRANFSSYHDKPVFQGNTESNQVVTHKLPRPIVARFVRIHPKINKGYRAHVFMRVEFYGCKTNSTLAWRCGFVDIASSGSDTNVNDTDTCTTCIAKEFENCTTNTPYCTGYNGSSFVYTITPDSSDDKHCEPKFNEDGKVHGYTLRKITAYSELHCADSCFQSHHCDAYDLKPTSDGTFECTLIKDVTGFEDKPPQETMATGFAFDRERFRKLMFGEPQPNSCGHN